MRLAPFSSFVLLSLFTACGSESQANADPLATPRGLEMAQLIVPEGNEPTADKVALGKQLFFDPRLSASGTMSCASCHHADKAFTDGQAHSKKDDGKMNSRNSPTMYNVGYYPDLYWDGRKKGLESNVLAAWTGQLGGDPEAVGKKLNANKAYQAAFQNAFSADPSEQTIVNALTSFLRTLRSGNSAYDRFAAGDKSALGDAAKKGHDLFFGKAGCVVCHTAPLFCDKTYHNVGIGMDAEEPDTGRERATKKAEDRGRFKTPTLRDVAKTAPYFHDGSVATLREAVKIMASGGKDNPNKDALLVDRGLSDEEIDQLVAFLEALSGDVAWTAPKLPE